MALTSNKLFISSTIFLGGLLLSILFEPFEAILTYSSANISASLIFIFICWFIYKTEVTSKTVLILTGVFILVRLLFIATIPIGSDDIYRYMWDGKLQASGINPYLYSPNDPALSNLHSNLLPRYVNFPDMKTIYFPFSQWLFYLGYLLSGENVWGYKLLIFTSELFTILAIYKTIKHLQLNKKYVLYYVLCPLSIIHFAVDAHLDALGFPLILFSILFYLKEKKIISSVLLGLSLSIKPVGLVFIPIYFLKEKKYKDKLVVAVVPLLVFFSQFIPYIFTTNPFEAFLIYTKNWMFNGFIFDLLNLYFNNNQTSRLISSVLLVISLIPIYFGKKNLVDKIYYSALFMMIFSPVVHPWYVGWIAILIPIAQKWSGIFYAALSSLTVITVLNYQLNGVWKDYLPILLIEYLPVIVFIFIELNKQAKRIDV